jgi:hypothetical protein
MPHSYERKSIEYERWVKMLNTVLLSNFGICVNDSFEEKQLKRRFSYGESPSDVLEEFGNKEGSQIYPAGDPSKTNKARNSILHSPLPVRWAS